MIIADRVTPSKPYEGMEGCEIMIIWFKKSLLMLNFNFVFRLRM